MAISLSDVFQFPDIVLNQEVTIEGWLQPEFQIFIDGRLPVRRENSDKLLLLPENPRLVPEENQAVEIIMIPKIGYIGRIWDVHYVRIIGTITEVKPAERIIEIHDVKQIVIDLPEYGLRIYSILDKSCGSGIKFLRPEIHIKDLLPQVESFYGQRITLHGILFGTAVGFTIVHKPHIAWDRTGTRFLPENEIKKRREKYEQDLPNEYRHSILLATDVDIYGFIPLYRSPYPLMHEATIIGQLMPTDKPHFAAEMRDCILILEDQYSISIWELDKYAIRQHKKS